MSLLFLSYEWFQLMTLTLERCFMVKDPWSAELPSMAPGDSSISWCLWFMPCRRYLWDVDRWSALCGAQSLDSESNLVTVAMESAMPDVAQQWASCISVCVSQASGCWMGSSLWRQVHWGWVYQIFMWEKFFARDKIEHRNLLCTHYLNKEPGLERVLRALAVHRQKASNGLTSPSQCFQKPLWNLWPQWKAQKKVTSAFGPLWKTQIALVFAMNFNGSPFSLAFAGVLHPHFNKFVPTLDKIDNLSTEFASSIFKKQHILLNWFFSSTDIFQKCPRAPWSTNDQITSSQTPKSLETPL